MTVPSLYEHSMDIQALRPCHSGDSSHANGITRVVAPIQPGFPSGVGQGPNGGCDMERSDIPHSEEAARLDRLSGLIDATPAISERLDLESVLQ